jgi:hypothetical protein
MHGGMNGESEGVAHTLGRSRQIHTKQKDTEKDDTIENLGEKKLLQMNSSSTLPFLVGKVKKYCFQNQFCGL